MGVKGLTSYVDSIGNLCTKLKLQNTKVVIDGSCLYYHLIYSCAQLNCRCGGQYTGLHDITISFFDSLKSSNVEPLVVLDGAYDSSDRKLATLIQRAKENILRACGLANGSPDCEHVLPLLTKRSFMQSMEEIGVKFVVCDCEADEEIASLANLLDCPVIGNDSDFFIYDLKQGYIPLKNLDSRSRPLTVNLFKSEKLARHLKISKDLLPLLASLLGNDFVSLEALSTFNSALKRIQQMRQPSKRHQRLTSVAQFLSKSNSLADGLQAVMMAVPEQMRHDLRKVLEASIRTYSYKEENELASLFEGSDVHSSLLSARKVALEPWVLKKFRQGLFPTACGNVLTVGKLFLRVQVENFSALSANQCSLELRRFIYGILMRHEVEPAENRAEALEGASVKEWNRDRKELRHYAVQPYDHAQGYGELPSLRTIPGLDMAERRKLCLTLLESNTNPVVSLPPELQLFAASLRQWIIHASPSIEEIHLRALLICSLKLIEDERMHEFQASKSKGQSDQRGFRPPLNRQHTFAQWQSVMQEAVHLNLILLEPLPTPRIRRLYDGVLVQDLVSKLERGQRTHMLLPCADEFEKLYKAVTDGIVGKLLPSAPVRSAGDSKYGPRFTSDLERAKKPRDCTSNKIEVDPNVKTVNRFGLLNMDSDSSTEEEDDEK